MLDDFDPFSTARGGPERRGPGRHQTLTALGELLDSVRREGDFEAVAVADQTGILVAGAGAFSTCEEIAALAPLALGAANDTIPTRIDVMSRRMQVRRLVLDGVEVLLCGHGGGGQSGQSGQSSEGQSLARAAAGCARILGSRERKR